MLLITSHKLTDSPRPHMPQTLKTINSLIFLPFHLHLLHLMLLVLSPERSWSRLEPRDVFYDSILELASIDFSLRSMRRHKILFLASFIFRLSLTARLDMERHSSCHNNPPRASRSTRSACTMQFILRCTRRRRIIAVCSSEKQESDQRAGQSPADGARVSPLLEWQKQIFNYGHDSNAVNSN
jgi:hypothetical protein